MGRGVPPGVIFSHDHIPVLYISCAHTYVCAVRIGDVQSLFSLRSLAVAIEISMNGGRGEK